uniref:Elongation factor 1-gamma n=1 Tax=Tanacetum cinerariifolium TaxID=118510 RepID=A0A6L2L5M4_TANCI|nr:elongation factor 1-gamma [Tanacetum cinerariifolium]
MALIMHSGPGNKNVYKALIAAEYVGVDIKMADNFQMGVSNKTPEFVKMNPMGKVPVLETPEGSVFESNAIARYVARGSSLLGSSAIEYGQIEQWIDFSSFELDANLRGWVLPRLGYANYIKPVEESYIANTKRALTALNTHLATHTFLVTGEIKQGDAVLPLPSAKKPEQPKEVKPKAEPKKVEAPKPAVEEEEEAPKPKAKNPLDLLPPTKKPEQPKEAKNPLDLLPPSKMVLDDWKRLYSNTKSNFREVAIKGFWDMFDPEGYSLWFCTYKYNDENTVSFVTMNKVGGFLQRMDLARKYAFGKMLIIGNEPPFKVKGLWLFRGPEIPQFVMDECYDMELYEWTKVDLSDEAQKEQVNQMIEDQEPFEGEALLDAKCFK